MTYRSLRALSSLLLLLSISAFASDVKLVAIRVVGSQEFTEAEVSRASGLKVNQVIGPAEFKNAADRLAGTGAFASVGYKYGPLGNGMFVEFDVEDAPSFLPVRFENFVWFTDAELNASLKERVPLYHGRLPEGGQIVDDVTAALTAVLAERESMDAPTCGSTLREWASQLKPYRSWLKAQSWPCTTLNSLVSRRWRCRN